MDTSPLTDLDTPSIHPAYARLLCMLLRSHGVDVDAALAPAGLCWSELATGEQWLSQATVNRLALAALSATGRPGLGIELGRAVPLSAHGTLGYAVVASRDLRQALEVVARFGALRHHGLHYALQPAANGGAVLRVHESLAPGEARRLVLDTVFGTCLRLMETVIGQPLPGLAVDLPLAEPAWRSEYQACVDGTLRFGAPQLAFHLPRALLALPCLTADAAAFDLACQQLEAALALAPSAATSASRVRALLGPQAMGWPSLSAAAERLQLSPRSLMRRLKAEGSSYQALLDERRQAQALWSLRHGQASVEAIAGELGFDDASNFGRTVRRWFGVTASALRAGAGPIDSRPHPAATPKPPWTSPP